MNCPACGAPNDAGARFCGSCGQPQASRPNDPAAPDPSAVPLCSSCGVVRAARKPNCPHCKASYGADMLRQPRSAAEDFWVCIECFFRCRACGFRVPLNHLDMDGGVLCARCGLDQAFEVQAWRQALQHAHAITEAFHLKLHGGAQGSDRDQEVARLGERQCSVTQTFAGANGFEVTSSPGYPLCPRCHAPLHVTTTESGTTTAACPACAITESYALPQTARKMTHGVLTGVIATEHAAGRAAVSVQQSAGAMAIVCPSCSAPLPASSDSKFLTCAYCKTVSRIPDHTWFQLNGQEPASEPIWLLFHGESQERAAFERAHHKHAHKLEVRAEAEHARASQEQAEGQERYRQEREKEQARRREEEAQQEAERQRAEKRAKGVRVRVWALGVGGALVSGGVAVAVALSNQSDAPATKHALSDGRAVATAVPSARAASVPDLARIRSCACTSQSTSGKDVFLLQVPTGTAASWSFDWTHSSGFVETESTIGLGGGAHAGVLPPKTADALRMGIACDGSIVAIVLGNRASAWSGTGNGALWTTTLPGVFATSTNAAVETVSSQGGAFDASCSTPIPVESGAIALSLGGGKRIHLSLKDGRVR